LVGPVPRGLPAPTLPSLDVFQHHYTTILLAASGLLLIGFSQTAGDARAFAVRHRYRIDINQESAAQGMANAASGAFQGMPVSTSLSASSLNESAGAATPLASLVTGGLVLATADALEERIRALVRSSDPPVTGVVLDLGAATVIDAQGAATLGEILDFTESSGVDLRLARVKPSVAAVLAEDGLLERF